MDDTSSYNSHAASGEPPVPIPAPEAAWENMLYKLEKELPTSGTLPLAATQKHSARKGIVLLLLIVFATTMVLLTDNRNAGLRHRADTHTENHMKTPTVNNATVKISKHHAPVQTNTDEKTSNTAMTLNSSKNTPTGQQKWEYPIYGPSVYNKKINAGIFSKQPPANKKKAIRALRKSASSGADVSNNVASKPPELFQKPTPAKKVASETKRKPDSAQQEPVVSLTNTLLVRTGLYWAEPLPFAGSAHYFAGAPASAQHYALLVPGVWVSLTAEHSSFALELHPLATALLPEKAFATTQQNMDSSVVTTAKYLLKVSGFAAGLHYHQKLGSGWWLGGGFQGNWWQKGLVETAMTIEKRDATNHTSVAEHKERKAYALNSTDVPDFAKFQLFTHADLLYKKRVWEAGVRTGVTFMPLAQKEGPKNQLQASLFFRLCLLQKQLTTK